ncbi:hypothetical protein TNCV_4255041 [Trichonephila clavipes]|nr:hypothetical protein TNCV_4255041 [Trichonephila clavipes]
MLIEEWVLLPQEMLHQLVLSMRRRCEATIAIEVLHEIVSTVNSAYPSIEVYVDGGIRSGSDVFKALALGAKAVFIGRPALWGLTMGWVLSHVGIPGNETADQNAKQGTESSKLEVPLTLGRASSVGTGKLGVKWSRSLAWALDK